MNVTNTSESTELPGAATPVDRQDQQSGTDERISLRRWLWHVFARQLTWWSVTALIIAARLGRKRRPIGPEGCEIMLTGRFESDNWILAHIGPLSASRRCARLWMVSTNPVPQLSKVEAIYPRTWLIKVLGATQARLLTFMWAAIWKRPHVVGGFHLIVNGIASAIVGCAAGARSMYFCVGGPPEVRDGGVHADDHLLSRMRTADSLVEERLLKLVSSFDMVITMGTGAATFLRDKGVEGNLHVVSGGINSERFHPGTDESSIDLILAGRLAPIKRIDIFLQAVRRVADRVPTVKAVIVGDGPLREELQKLSEDLGIAENVAFAGRRDDVEHWLRSSRIFVLTSDSEGLSLSMMEAMISGLPAVVSDVGDLGDLVENGVNGYLVPRRSPQLFADCIVELLQNEQKLEKSAEAARRSAMKYATEATVQLWDRILTDI